VGSASAAVNVRSLVTVAVVLYAATLGGGAESHTAQARQLLHDAEAAQAAGDQAGGVAKLQAAVDRQPGWPELRLKLATAQVVAGRTADAIATLGGLAALGVFQPAETDNAFAPLRTNAEFQAALAALRSNLQPRGAGEVVFELPNVHGLIEGIGSRAAMGAYYFGDAHERCVWLRTADGAVTRFSQPDDRLLGVFRIAVDERRGALWAAMGAVPQMARYSDSLKGTAGLAELDLKTGELRRVISVPRDGVDHLIGDLVLASDGTVYATDTFAPIVWRLRPGETRLEVLVRSDAFGSLQGVACSPDGRGLFVTDYAEGVAFIDFATRSVRVLEPPANVTVLGCDTLVVAPDGALIAVQNGTQPQRVLRLEVDRENSALARVEVLLSGHPAMVDATLGTIAGDAFVLVANGGWNRFEPGAPATGAVSVPIVRVPLKRGVR
jgi:sugar lactone lactonase YvrE